MKVKASEAIGLTLDWMVERAKGTYWSPNGYFVFKRPDGTSRRFERNPQNRYSTDPVQAVPIIEQEGVALLPPTVRRIGKERHAFSISYWRAIIQRDENELAIHGAGPTPLIAAMRYYAESKLGDEVEVPEDLEK